MTNPERKWTGQLQFIVHENQSVMVFEPDVVLRESFENALRAAGHFTHAYATIAEAEASEFPHVIEYVFYNISFGQTEKPQDRWSVYEFLRAFSIDVPADNVQLYYTTDVATVAAPVSVVRAAVKYEPGWADMFFALPTSPVVRDQLVRYRQATLLELGLYLSVLFGIGWGVMAAFPLVLVLAVLTGLVLIAYSPEEIATGIANMFDSDYRGGSPTPMAGEERVASTGSLRAGAR